MASTQISRRVKALDRHDAEEPLIARLRRALAPEEGCLRRREARDGHAEGRAGDVIEADLPEEADGLRVTPVLSADPELDLRACLPAALARELDQRADAHGVD